MSHQIPTHAFPPSDPADFFAAPPRLSSQSSPDIFFGTSYEPNQDSGGNLISILSGGSVRAKFPYFFSLTPLGCYLLLYTKGGCGKLSAEGNACLLEENTLLLFQCDVPFKIETTVSPWDYTFFFLTGSMLSFYYGCMRTPARPLPLFSLSEYTPAIKDILKLAANDTGASMKNKLTDHQLLTNIFTGLILEHTQQGATGKNIPSYLQKVKTLFDLEYRKNYTLDELEELFSVSKYRLCREFHEVFGQPPLQYLNERRIASAKELLLTTDCRVHEIGSQVGIDNTNHFIYLFKKFTGMTPLAFRRKH